MAHTHTDLGSPEHLQKWPPAKQGHPHGQGGGSPGTRGALEDERAGARGLARERLWWPLIPVLGPSHGHGAWQLPVALPLWLKSLEACEGGGLLPVSQRRKPRPRPGSWPWSPSSDVGPDSSPRPQKLCHHPGCVHTSPTRRGQTAEQTDGCLEAPIHPLPALDNGRQFAGLGFFRRWGQGQSHCHPGPPRLLPPAQSSGGQPSFFWTWEPLSVFLFPLLKIAS